MRRKASAIWAGIGLAGLVFTSGARARATGGETDKEAGYGATSRAPSTEGTLAAPGDPRTSSAAGGAGGPTSQGMSAATLGPNQVQSRVREIDRKNDTLTLANGNQISITPGTGVWKNGFKGSPGDIQRGDDVRVSFTPGSTTNVQQIEAISPPGTFQPVP